MTSRISAGPAGPARLQPARRARGPSEEPSTHRPEVRIVWRRSGTPRSLRPIFSITMRAAVAPMVKGSWSNSGDGAGGGGVHVGHAQIPPDPPAGPRAPALERRQQGVGRHDHLRPVAPMPPGEGGPVPIGQDERGNGGEMPPGLLFDPKRGPVQVFGALVASGREEQADPPQPAAPAFGHDPPHARVAVVDHAVELRGGEGVLDHDRAVAPPVQRKLAAGLGQGADDDPRNIAREQDLIESLLRHARRVEREKLHLVSLLGGGGLRPGEVRLVRVLVRLVVAALPAHVRQESQRDGEVRPPPRAPHGDQRRDERMRPVVQPRGDALDPAPGGVRDPRVVAQRAGDGGLMHARGAGDILHDHGPQRGRGRGGHCALISATAASTSRKRILA